MDRDPGDLDDLDDALLHDKLDPIALINMCIAISSQVPSILPRARTFWRRKGVDRLVSVEKLSWN